MNRVCDILLERKLITPEALESYRLEDWAKDEDYPGAAFVGRGYLTEDTLGRAVAAAMGIDFCDLGRTDVDEEIALLISFGLKAQCLAVPIDAARGSITVAMVDPTDLSAVDDLQFVLGRPIAPVVVAYTPWKELLWRIHPNEMSEGLPSDRLTAMLEAEGEGTALLPEGEGAAVSEAPTARLLQQIFEMAIARRASDLHFEPGPSYLLVRARVDGILVDLMQVPRYIQNALGSRIKILAELDIAERRRPQDGRLSVQLGGQSVDLRVSTVPSLHGEKIVLRILDAHAGNFLALDEIGLSERQEDALARVRQSPQGLVLVTGPTGSGKTTTMYGLLRSLQCRSINIVTIEDPVECKIEGVTQIQVQEQIGLTFASLLRNVLRQDPDVVLVGEIRDAETASIAYRAAMTGHLVLSTLHTNDAAGTVTRLADLGIDPSQIESSLLLVVAQRLVRLVCPECRARVEPAPDVRRRFGLGPSESAYQGTGCVACGMTGYRGRTGIYEFLEVKGAVREAIARGKSEGAVREAAHQAGMLPLEAVATDLVREGRTSPEEALRVVSFPEDLQLAACPDCGRTVLPAVDRCPHCDHVATPQERESLRSRPPCRDAAAAQGPAPIALPGKLEVPRILVIDDEEEARRSIVQALEELEYPVEIHSAAGGFEALGKAGFLRPELVLVDVVMPGMDGYQVTARLRENCATASLPVLLLSERGDKKGELRGYRSGADDYLLKPFDPQTLRDRVTRLLERSYGFTPAGESVA